MPISRRCFLGASAAAVAVAATTGTLSYRRQIVSYLTHWRGSPSDTSPYDPPVTTPGLHLAAAGDSGDSGVRLDATGAAMASIAERGSPYDALLLLGDNVYPNGDPSRVPATVFEPFTEVLSSGTELLAILGNHDIRDGNGPAQLEALGMEGPYWKRVYAQGDVIVVGLDSNNIDDAAQLEFVDAALADSVARFKIVALHHPPYSAGYQGSSLDVRATICPLVVRHGVQLVLSGHDHDYQRSVPIDGVTYVVSGGGAGTRRTGSDDFTAVSWSWHHFLDICVFDDRLELRAINQDGRVGDRWTSPAPRR